METKTIGKFIAALRKANGLTQQELADRLSVSNKAVSRWERDECAPDLSLIPAIAEMFGVTCDELLKGERILEPVPAEKCEYKVEARLKSLVNRAVSGFRTLILISIAISVVGLVCMFGISYGFYRPEIGFAVMLLFAAAAFVTAAVAVNKLKEAGEDNELFDRAGEQLIKKYNDALGSSFAAFFAVAVTVMLSLPLVLITSDYAQGVMTLRSYFIFSFGEITLVSVWGFVRLKEPYAAWITGSTPERKAPDPVLRKMNVIQIGAAALTGLLNVIAPYCEMLPTDKFTMYDVVLILALACAAANIVCFVVFIIRERAQKGKLLLPGIRNIFLIPSALLLQKAHYRTWIPRFGDGKKYYEAVDMWCAEYLWYAAGLAVIVAVVFSLIDAFIKRNKK